MKELKELMRVLFAIFRYPLTIVVALVASIIAAANWQDVSQNWAPNGDSAFWDLVCYFFAGLAGVTAGSFCLPRNQRWIGSLCLLFLGLGFALFVLGFGEDDSEGGYFFPLVPLTVGGIIPVIIHYLLRNKRPIEIPL